MLNLNGSLTKAGVPYSTLWSETFADDAFRKKLHQWLQVGHVTHDLSHVRPFVPASAPDKARSVGRDVAQNFRQRRAIMGIFDEGCMGMYNAIIPDELLFPLGVFKERLSAVRALRRLAGRVATPRRAPFMTGSSPRA